MMVGPLRAMSDTPKKPEEQIEKPEKKIPDLPDKPLSSAGDGACVATSKSRKPLGKVRVWM